MWSQADAGLAPFALPAPADYLSRNPNQMFDFSLTNTYSDLDVTRVEAGVSFKFGMTEKLSLLGQYRYVDLQDDAPYLEETSGTVDFYSLALGYRF